MSACPNSSKINHSELEIRLRTRFFIEQNSNRTSFTGRVSEKVMMALDAVPANAVWLYAWQAYMSVHWAFWCLFIVPAIGLGLLAGIINSPIIVGIIDILSVLWVLFSTTLVWRAGLVHAGKAFMPMIYRVFTLFITLPLTFGVIGVFIEILWA